MVTKIPNHTYGAASRTEETFGQVDLFMPGPPPQRRTKVTVGESTTLAIYSVVGRNSAGEIVMAEWGAGEQDHASGTLTLSDVAVADETVVIGDTTYTWKASVGTTANEVLVGANAAACAANLIAAINAAPQTEGSEVYGTDTAQNPDVVASQGATAAVVEVIANVPGQSGEIATTETMTNGAWGAATLTGGVGDGIAPIGILTAAVSTGVGESAVVDVFRDGTWNANALEWHESYNTVAKREAAFEGSLSPTLYIGHNPNDPTFTA